VKLEVKGREGVERSRDFAFDAKVASELVRVPIQSRTHSTSVGIEVVAGRKALAASLLAASWHACELLARVVAVRC